MMADNMTNQATALRPSLPDNQRRSLQAACSRIAPTWPLDELIAVNPWWEMRDEHVSQVSARLSALTQANCVMPKAYFQEIWMETLQPQHLEAAIAEFGKDYSVETMERYLLNEDDQTHWHNISDFVDSGPNRKYKMAWRDEITHQISQFCADFFAPKMSSPPLTPTPIKGFTLSG